MKNVLQLVMISLILLACTDKTDLSSIDPVNWDKRKVNFTLNDSLISGTTYLSVYSQIYIQTEHKTHDLTATVSMRNTNINDTIFVNKAEYFNTEGKPIRTYFKKPIFIAPLETVEIVIDGIDQEGGTGANFIFNWTKQTNSNEPFFEAVMVSSSGQYGLSFTTQGVKID